MAVLVGIDEAGYGPILGPLVISSVGFSVPDEQLKADFWHILRKSIFNRKNHLAGRLLIADSKKAYTRSQGLGHLERTVLSCIECLHKRPETLGQLLEILSPDLLERIDSYPWYKKTAGHKVVAASADTAIASNVLKNDLAANGMELLGLESVCLDVAYYNRMIDLAKNKSIVLFSATARLMQKAFERFGRDNLQILIDRQGGRVHYRRELQRMFGDMELTILGESQSTSSYELSDGMRRMRIHFAVGADNRFLPVSLASMTSKYLRELLIANINRYFMGFGTELKPTAGYWKDGLRFIKDLKTNLPHVQYVSNQLIRCR
jgi:ribonuclease HII